MTNYNSLPTVVLVDHGLVHRAIVTVLKSAAMYHYELKQDYLEQAKMEYPEMSGFRECLKAEIELT